MREGGINDWQGVVGQKIPRFDNRIIGKCVLIAVTMSLIPNSLGGVALLVAACSAILAWPVCYARPAILRWGGAVFVPLAFSYCIYWLPVWRGANPSEYSAWEVLGIGVPFLAGLIASILVMFILSRTRAK